MDYFDALSLLLATALLTAGFLRHRIGDLEKYRKALTCLVAALILYYAAFPTKDAWGYVLARRFEFNNAIGAVNMAPRFSFAQYVNGVSPGPGGSVLEGRKPLTFGLGLQYRFNWEFDVSYTSFFGADRYNLINDRDFIASNFKFSF